MRGLDFLAIDLTHRCNLHCRYCSKFTSTGTFQATSADVDLFCRLCADTPARTIRIGGGDVLTHPCFDDLFRQLMTVDKPLEVATNGLLLPRYEWILNVAQVVHITLYPGHNDHIRKRYDGHPRINWIDYGPSGWREKWWDPNYDPNWSVAEAQEAYNKCPCCMVTVVGNKVYGCGVAEPLERVKGIGPAHIKLREGWMVEFERFDNLRTCQHCFQMAGVYAPTIGPDTDK